MPDEKTSATTIPIEQFGRDHWSTFAYIESRCVDYCGAPDREHMRCDPARHPGHANSANRLGGGLLVKYPTRLAGGVERADHDDYDCADDLAAAGLIEIGGTGLYPIYQLTARGREVAASLRAHKALGRGYSTFTADAAVGAPAAS